jgi:hypothetical protein
MVLGLIGFVLPWIELFRGHQLEMDTSYILSTHPSACAKYLSEHHCVMDGDQVTMDSIAVKYRRII